MRSPTTISVRPTKPADIPALTVLLNDIIAIGGTTAYQEPLTEQAMAAKLLNGPQCIGSFTAFDPHDGVPAGFQYLSINPGLPANWADIATFARAAPKVPGIGSALFAATAAFAGEKGFDAINATIRADNEGGLAFYSKMGFEDYAVARAVPLKDGTPVDRISKRLDLRAPVHQ